MILHTFESHGHRFGLKVLDDGDAEALAVYCRTMAEEGVPNNATPAALKIGRWPGEDRFWATYDLDTGRMVSLSGAHPLPEVAPHCWRVMFRLGTIKAYRGKAGGLRKDQGSCFGWGRTLPFQIDYAHSRGAEKIVFTTNTGGDGDRNSLRQNRICEGVFEKLGMARKIDERVLFGVRQAVWEVLVRDIREMENRS